jgi:hypothetical protein
MILFKKIVKMKKCFIEVVDIRCCLLRKLTIFLIIKGLRYKVLYINPKHYRFKIERKNSSEWIEYDPNLHYFYAVGTFSDNNQSFFEIDSDENPVFE